MARDRSPHAGSPVLGSVRLTFKSANSPTLARTEPLNMSQTQSSSRKPLVGPPARSRSTPCAQQTDPSTSLPSIASDVESTDASQKAPVTQNLRLDHQLEKITFIKGSSEQSLREVPEEVLAAFNNWLATKRNTEFPWLKKLGGRTNAFGAGEMFVDPTTRQQLEAALYRYGKYSDQLGFVVVKAANPSEIIAFNSGLPACISFTSGRKTTQEYESKPWTCMPYEAWDSSCHPIPVWKLIEKRPVQRKILPRDQDELSQVEDAQDIDYTKNGEDTTVPFDDIDGEAATDVDDEAAGTRAARKRRLDAIEHASSENVKRGRRHASLNTGQDRPPTWATDEKPYDGAVSELRRSSAPFQKPGLPIRLSAEPRSSDSDDNGITASRPIAPRPIATENRPQLQALPTLPSASAPTNIGGRIIFLFKTRDGDPTLRQCLLSECTGVQHLFAHARGAKIANVNTWTLRAQFNVNDFKILVSNFDQDYHDLVGDLEKLRGNGDVFVSVMPDI